MKFSYEACLRETPCIINITEKEGGAGTIYEVCIGNTFLMYVKKEDGFWKSDSRLPEGIYSDDVEAIGDEVEKRL